jgi:glutathione peroxidase
VPSDFYDLSARALDGEEIAFSRYRGKVVLVVNTASHCGFTHQYAGLEALHRRHADSGLAVLGFPCNQFGGQEPGERDSIEACLTGFGVDFQMFEKVEVNGANAHPVFRWLTAALPGLVGARIKWNFTKFLIGRDGRPIDRYAPLTSPEGLESDVVAALART